VICGEITEKTGSSSNISLTLKVGIAPDKKKEPGAREGGGGAKKKTQKKLLLKPCVRGLTKEDKREREMGNMR